MWTLCGLEARWKQCFVRHGTVSCVSGSAYHGGKPYSPVPQGAPQATLPVSRAPNTQMTTPADFPHPSPCPEPHLTTAHPKLLDAD